MAVVPAASARQADAAYADRLARAAREAAARSIDAPERVSDGERPRGIPVAYRQDYILLRLAGFIFERHAWLSISIGTKEL